MIAPAFKPLVDSGDLVIDFTGASHSGDRACTPP